MSCLRNETIVIRPVEENPAMHIPKGKNGHVRFEGSFTTYDAPMSKHGSGVVSVLTDDERIELEKLLDASRPKGWLSGYARDNAWTGRNRYKIELGLEEVELNLMDPVQFIKYRILLANTQDIAPSFEQRTDKAYMFYMENKETIDKGKLEKVSLKIEAGNKFAELVKSEDKLMDALMVIFRGDISKVPNSMTSNTAQVALYNYIDTKPREFLDSLKDVEYGNKVLFYKAIRRGVITRNGFEYNLGMGDGRLIGNGMAEALKFIEDMKTNNSKQEQFMKFQAALKRKQ